MHYERKENMLTLCVNISRISARMLYYQRPYAHTPKSTKEIIDHNCGLCKSYLSIYMFLTDTNFLKNFHTYTSLQDAIYKPQNSHNLICYVCYMSIRLEKCKITGGHLDRGDIGYHWLSAAASLLTLGPRGAH